MLVFIEARGNNDAIALTTHRDLDLTPAAHVALIVTEQKRIPRLPIVRVVWEMAVRKRSAVPYAASVEIENPQGDICVATESPTPASLMSIPSSSMTPRKRITITWMRVDQDSVRSSLWTIRSISKSVMVTK